MKKSFRILLPMILGAFPLIMGCPSEGQRMPMFWPTWMTNMPDSRKLNTLALIGTHNSATYRLQFGIIGTQWMSVSEQLERGIRVFEMRVRRIENVFAMHHERLYLGMMFGDILNDVVEFLRAHPNELVIMFMQEEYEAEATTMSECEILENKYIKQHSNLFVQYWSVDDTIGQHRGKILLAVANRGFHRCITNLPCEKQNNWELNKGYTEDDKWNDIKALQDKMFDPNEHYECYINFLSAHGGWTHGNPYTIANGVHQSHGYYTAVVNVDTPGINDKIKSYFRNPKNTLYIIMADYIPFDLIFQVVDSN